MNRIITPKQMGRYMSRSLRQAEKANGLRHGELVEAIRMAAAKLDAMPIPVSRRKLAPLQ